MYNSSVKIEAPIEQPDVSDKQQLQMMQQQIDILTKKVEHLERERNRLKSDIQTLANAIVK
jgi:prefoldin subunit 5